MAKINVQDLIKAAAQAANEIATTVASKAAEKAAIASKEAKKEEALARVEFRALVGEVGPQRADLLEKDGKLEATIKRFVDRMNTSHERCGRIVHHILAIQKWVDSSNEDKKILGTTINALGYKIAKASIEAKGFKDINKVPRDFKEALIEKAISDTPEIQALVMAKEALIEKAISDTPEIQALVMAKEALTEKVERILNIRLSKEENLFKEGKYFQKQIKCLELLDAEVSVTTDPEVSMMLRELPIYGAWKFDFSKNHVVFTRKVKAIKDSLAALKRAKKAAEKVIAEKAVAKEEAFYKDAIGDNIISLADAKELKVLKEASAKRGNTKVLTAKTLAAAKKAL